MERRCSSLAIAALLPVLLLPSLAVAEPSPGKASAISLTCTLGPGAISAFAFAADSPEIGFMVLATGVLFGPATGYIYGDRPGRGFAGAGIRAGLGVVGLVGVGMALGSESNESPSGAIAFFAGGIGLAGSMIWDLAMVGRDVQAHNDRRSSTGGMPFPDYDPSHAPRRVHGGPKCAGRVFDRILYRDSLAGPDASGSTRADALAGVIWQTLMRRYLAEEGAEATPAEVDEVIRAAKIDEPLPVGREAEIRESAKTAVLMWKLNRSLYQRYGGVVVSQQLDRMAPVGAHHAFLKEMEKRQVFVIFDAKLRSAFWERFSPGQQFQVPPEKVNFETPWWLQRPPVAPDSSALR